jgi:hypothetical protein
MAYATTTDVSNELNGFTIDNSSVPSSATVDTWIAQESDMLNRETGRIWGSTTYTDEYLDYDGSGYIRLNHAPVISITSFANERNGLNASTESWLTLTEGRAATDSFILYKEEGELQFHGVLPLAGYQNCKVTYVAGYETVNPTVTAIIAKRVALRLIDSIVNSQASAEGGNVTVGAISISDPSTFSLDRVKSLGNDIQTLTNTLGSFKTYRYNRR